MLLLLMPRIYKWYEWLMNDKQKKAFVAHFFVFFRTPIYSEKNIYSVSIRVFAVHIARLVNIMVLPTYGGNPLKYLFNIFIYRKFWELLVYEFYAHDIDISMTCMDNDNGHSTDRSQWRNTCWSMKISLTGCNKTLLSSRTNY